jgi:signal transduction histidine kinase
MIGLGLAAVIGGITAYWLAGRALRPVGDLVWAVQQINADTLSHHLAFEGPQDELKALADAFNTMLNRLQRAFEQQSRFVADAAHELRTPLATMRANLEVIFADAQARLEDYREASTVQERSLTPLERLVDDLLLLAQGERGIAKGEVALGPLVEEVLLNLTPLAAERQVALRFSGSRELILLGTNCCWPAP